MVIKQRSLTLLCFFSLFFSMMALGQNEKRHLFEVKTAPIRYLYGANIEGELRYDNMALIGGYQVYNKDFYFETGSFFTLAPSLVSAKGEMSWLGIRNYWQVSENTDVFVGFRYRRKTVSFKDVNHQEAVDGFLFGSPESFEDCDEKSDMYILTVGVKQTLSFFSYELYIGGGINHHESKIYKYEVSYFDGYAYQVDYIHKAPDLAYFTFGLTLGFGY